MLFNPTHATFDTLDPPSRAIMHQTIAFFEAKGKRRLKHDYGHMVWYSDFLDFIRENRIFATLLTPAAYGQGAPAVRWDTDRICRFNEILGFYGLPYWYAWQVSILGLGPIWMSPNEEAKRQAARLLQEGHIFAFGLSEKRHGADLYATEMSLTPLGGGRYVADGGKYYIGNGNAAAMISTFGKNSETGEYVFFVADSRHPHYDCLQNVVAWQGYVSEYALNGYPITEAEILSTGRQAWDAALNTVNVGKFNLGWAAIGICTHAFFEALQHASRRNLYGRWVTDFPHIRQLLTDAYVRLVAMKCFSSRAIDYLRSASADDRRYLLYNPLVKMKVTTQGEAVINLLWDVIAARGFEKETYFEMAAKEIRSLPKLEGTVHVNMALIVKFMANYFFHPADFPPVPRRDDAADDAFLFRQGPTGGLGGIRFHDPEIAYTSVTLPNVGRFREQIAQFRRFLAEAPPDPAQAADIDFLLNLGEIFTLVVYGQLIIEKANLEAMDPHLLDQIFDVMIRDFSHFALQLYSQPSSTPAQMAICMAMIRKPVVDVGRFGKIWSDYVIKEKDAYEMNP